MVNSKFICKQTEKGDLETGENADGENLENEKKEIKGTQKTVEIIK